MHIYIYDSEVSNNPKYQSTTAKIETRITDLGLNGKIIRLSMITSLGEAIANEVKKGAKTITVVGEESSFFAAVNKIASLKTIKVINNKIPLAFIPINSSIIGEKFGISNFEEACDAISARRIINFDLGQANNELFLTEARIVSENSIIDIDQNYSIELLNPGNIKVVNLPVFSQVPPQSQIKADDKKLELLIENIKGRGLAKQKITNQSIFSFNELTVINKKHKLVLDNYKELVPPVVIRVAPVKIEIITGKQRGF